MLAVLNVIVRSASLFWLKPVYSEWLLLKPCCMGMCEEFSPTLEFLRIIVNIQ